MIDVEEGKNLTECLNVKRDHNVSTKLFPLPRPKPWYVPESDTFFFTPIKAFYMYNKIDQDELITTCKFSSKHMFTHEMAHIYESTSSCKTNPYHEYILAFSLKELKPQK